ncbi:PHP domain-containing protein [Christensenella intestinihominis]|uniref:PHP domain-containing protein n=1 Tax=Christensenella intestinihominis TaxID=1851429 RepID=UPI0011C6F878|nr:PHP domain-containing protein [Christensenella intestinihominis]
MTEKKKSDKMMDLHNHTFWSDGENSVAEIMEHAKECGIGVIGICDHFLAGETKALNENDLDTYVAELNKFGNIYAPAVCLAKGLEVPIFAFNQMWDDTLIKKVNKLDYILIEDYNNVRDDMDVSYILNNIRKIQCRKGLAHTAPTENAVAFMNKNNLFWEMNIGEAYDFYRYVDEYEKEDVKDILKKLNCNGIKVSIGTDSHTLMDYPMGRLSQANKIVGQYLKRLDVIK